MDIVLIEPQIPQNTGNIARTCAATNCALHIVKPMGFKVDEKKLKRAGLDYWDKLRVVYYEDSEDFFSENKGKKMYFFTTKSSKIYTDVAYESDAMLVFGREDKGLSYDILKANEETCVRLPMAFNIRSLNLSNTVSVAVYEVLRQTNYKQIQKNV